MHETACITSPGHCQHCKAGSTLLSVIIYSVQYTVCILNDSHVIESESSDDYAITTGPLYLYCISHYSLVLK